MFESASGDGDLEVGEVDVNRWLLFEVTNTGDAPPFDRANGDSGI